MGVDGYGRERIEPRPPGEWERDAIVALLAFADEPGRTALLATVPSLVVCSRCECRCSTVDFESLESIGRLVARGGRQVIGGIADDADGHPIWLAVHVVAGAIIELKAIRHDRGGPLLVRPSPAAIRREGPA